MLSMTGYGSASVNAGDAVIVVDARAVNSRFLDVHTRLPAALGDHVSLVDEVARKHLVRGRVDISGRLEGLLPGTVALDRRRAISALDALRRLRDELGIDEAVPLSLLSAVPGLFAELAGPATSEVRDAVEQAATLACQALTRMRRAEGLTLAGELRGRTNVVAGLAATITALAPELARTHREKLRGRIAGLLEGTGASLDLGRLEHELALLADRTDVTEEATRVQSHCAQLLAILDEADDEPTGRKLEFLLQELNREVNTLGSKVSDTRVIGHVLELKAELERMREQVQNIL
jgi:uncharacterized protein (TIGR00255 family)